MGVDLSHSFVCVLLLSTNIVGSGKSAKNGYGDSDNIMMVSGVNLQGLSNCKWLPVDPCLFFTYYSRCCIHINVIIVLVVTMHADKSEKAQGNCTFLKIGQCICNSTVRALSMSAVSCNDCYSDMLGNINASCFSGIFQLSEDCFQCNSTSMLEAHNQTTCKYYTMSIYKLAFVFIFI